MTTVPTGPEPAAAGPVDLRAAAEGLDETWSPRVAATVNDVLVKVVRVAGDFVWHEHPDTDEAFLVFSGELTIDLRDGDAADERSVTLGVGDLFVVPRGVFHRPHTAVGASVALLEAAGVVNTGGVESDLTAPVDRPLDA